MNNSLESLLDEFTQYLVLLRDRDPATAKSYIYDIRDYEQFLHATVQSVGEEFQINPDLFQRYVVYMRGKKISNSTITRRLCGTRAFWVFLYKKGYIATFPESFDMMDIVIKKQRRPTEPLNPNDYERLISEICHELSIVL